LLPEPRRGSSVCLLALLALSAAAKGTPVRAYQEQTTCAICRNEPCAICQNESCVGCQNESCIGCEDESCVDCQDERCSACAERACTDCAEVEEAELVATGSDPWWLLYSDVSPQDRLLFGMWSYHLRDLSSGAPSNGLMGLVYDGFMAATFITTHGPRGYALGVERTWISQSLGPTELMIGYRAGLVHGYDHRLFRLAEISPVIPFLQPVLFMRGGRFTFDATYTYVVVSFTAGFRF